MAKYRLVLCNFKGIPEAILTNAVNPRITYRLNAPAQLTFALPKAVEESKFLRVGKFVRVEDLDIAVEFQRCKRRREHL